jgi:translocation and assembly module TamA
MSRAFRVASLLLIACALLPGCALLRGEKEKTAAAPEAAASAPAGPPAYELDISAPDDLKKLLQTHLELARFRATSETGELTKSELDRLIATTPAQARALLETEGYFNAQVTAEREEGAQPPRVRVAVAPGPRATIASVSIDAQGPLQEQAAAKDARAAGVLADFKRRFALHEGLPFRQATWNEAKTVSIGMLRAQGYAAAQWHETDAQVDVASNSVKLTLMADSGPLFLAGDIEIEGLERQNDHAIRNLAGFGRGAVLTEKLLLDYQERLQKVGLFDRASVEIDPDPAQAGAATVHVHVHEQSLQQTTIGVGYSANTGQRAQLEHTHRKPFGLNAIAHNKFELGRDRQAWEGELSSHPGKGFYRNLIAGAVEHLQSDGERRNSSRIRVGRAQDAQTVERLSFVELEDSDLRKAEVDEHAQALSLNQHVVLRRLDSIVLPTDGYSLSLQGGVGQAHSNYADAGPFIRAYGRLTFYKPLGGSWYGQARLELGEVFAKDSVGLPDTKLFRAGGDDSVRGYAYRSLGPTTADGTVVSGRVLLTSSLEVARPVSRSMPSLWWAAFIDAGQAADSWRGMTLARGYGLGLRWRSPVGPLRVDLAYGEQVKHVRLHFSVGIAF